MTTTKRARARTQARIPVAKAEPPSRKDELLAWERKLEAKEKALAIRERTLEIGERDMKQRRKNLAEYEAEVAKIRKEAVLAESMWKAGFADSLYSIQSFLRNDAEDGECLESFQPNWAFGSFEINWRLGKRHKPYALLPLFLPDPKKSGIEVLPVTTALRKREGGAYLPEVGRGLVLKFTFNRDDPGPKRVRQYAEEDGREDWLR